MFTVGVDFGTNSVRALVVRCSDGAEYGTAVVDYPTGEQGVLLDRRDPNLARQNPEDYLFGLRRSVRAALSQAAEHDGFRSDLVVGIGVDSTGSSPIPVDRDNAPLASDLRFRGDVDAQCWLWKDHTAWWEAGEITRVARETRPAYVAACGDTYSSEWFWAKIWRCLRVAPHVFDAAHSWVELADWVPSVLAGVADPADVRRGVCAAGHKAMFDARWGGLPDAGFLASLDPRLAALRPRLYDEAFDASVPAGALCAAWAAELGLPEGVPVAIGAFDVHFGAIGCGVEEGTLVKVIGTSTCDCGVVPAASGVDHVPGICGIVAGSILPGFLGVEAGQSAVGDIFKWWVEGICRGDAALHGELAAEAAAQAPGRSGLLGLDWNNGNRTVLVDQRLTGLMLGQTLQTSRAEVYRALIEATAFGARAIIERLREYGVPVDRVVCTGGIAEKNPLLMQIYADVTGCTMLVAGSAQTCALGGAMVASVLAGAHADLDAAKAAMTSLRDVAYRPRPAEAGTYDRLYDLYRRLHDGFGGVSGPVELGDVMKQLLAIRDEAAR